MPVDCGSAGHWHWDACLEKTPDRGAFGLNENWDGTFVPAGMKLEGSVGRLGIGLWAFGLKRIEHWLGGSGPVGSTFLCSQDGRTGFGGGFGGGLGGGSGGGCGGGFGLGRCPPEV